jgi:hypothetical protein
MGYGTRSEWSPVLGLWEAVPLWVDEHGCDSATLVSLSAGYRWTGMHELYLGGKYGEMPWFCID